MAIAVLIHALVFLAFWLTNMPYQETLNSFLMGTTGWRANFLLIFLLIAGLVALWSTARLIWRRSLRKKVSALLPVSIDILFLAFFYGSFIFLFVKNPVQLVRLGQLFQYFRLFIDAGLLLILAWGLPRWLKSYGWKIVFLPAGLILLWVIPIFWTPGNVFRGALPEKPRLIAHRGASTLAPENTLASMQAAANLGIYGLETDISVSTDGILFLMHDNTLARTTDVAEVFPGRRDDLAETFTWAELSRLDAGSWFNGWADTSPEHIPTLEALLQLARQDDVYFIYDLRIPSAGHPYADQAQLLSLEELKASGMAGYTWILAAPDAIAQVRTVLPEAILAAGIGYTDRPPSPASLIASGYRVVNSVYGLSIRNIHAYQQAGLWVNLWVVDESWQYARLWLAGADSVTSNNVQGLLAQSRPFLAMSFGSFLLVWGSIGVVAALIYWWSRRRSSTLK